MNKNESSKEIIQIIKELVDKAYDTTKSKYDDKLANTAMTNFFLYYVTNNFTRKNNARKTMEDLTYRVHEVYQILVDYAISSFILNNMECDLSNDELIAYANDKERKLDYSGKKAVKIVAIASAINTYWTYNLISVNKKLKLELVLNFIAERYIQNKRSELDNTKNTKIIKVEGHDGLIIMSKSKLNNDVRNMNNYDEIEEYQPPKSK